MLRRTEPCRPFGSIGTNAGGGTLAGVWYDNSAAAPSAASQTQIGAESVKAAGHFGNMVALHAADIVEVPLEDALAEPKLLDPELYQTAEVFFG